MKFKKQLIAVFVLSLSLLACNKEKVTSSIPQLNSESAEVLVKQLIKEKNSFYESDNTKADFDDLFTTIEMANSLESELEKEKENLSQLGIKYVSHQSNVKIKSSTKNNDGSQTFLIEELTVIKTNQISAITNEVINVTIQQQYSLTLKANANGYLISDFIDLDKQQLQNKKHESEIQNLSKAEENEIEAMTQKLSAVAGTYNRNNVFTYATTYAITPNPLYQDFSPGLCSYCGGDCTNFMSQCFLAGGWSQIYGSSSSLSVFWYGLKSNPNGYKNGFSGTWVSAQKMGFFLKNLTSRVTRVTSLSNLQLADGVQLVGNTGNAFHSLIVTQVSKTGNIFLSCHTSNRYNAPVSNWGLTATTNYSGILPKAFLWKVKNSF